MPRATIRPNACLRLGRVAELDAGEIEAALGAQLLPLRRRQRGLVLAERVLVALGVVERRRLGDHGRDADPLHVVRVGLLPGRRARRPGVALDHLVLDQDRAVLVVARRRAVEVLLLRQGRGLGDDQAGADVGQGQAEAHRRRGRGGHARHRAGQEVLGLGQVRRLERQELELRELRRHALRDPPLEQQRRLGLLAGDHVEHRVEDDALLGRGRVLARQRRLDPGEERRQLAGLRDQAVGRFGGGLLEGLRLVRRRAGGDQRGAAEREQGGGEAADGRCMAAAGAFICTPS